LATKATLLTLTKKLFMKEDLKQLIKEFNEIKYPKNDAKRIVIATLQADCDKSLYNKVVTG